jgi:hypothetical protein
VSPRQRPSHVQRVDPHRRSVRVSGRVRSLWGVALPDRRARARRLTPCSRKFTRSS